MAISKKAKMLLSLEAKRTPNTKSSMITPELQKELIERPVVSRLKEYLHVSNSYTQSEVERLRLERNARFPTLEECGDIHKDVFESFIGTITGETTKIPKESFDKIIDSIMSADFNTSFEFDHSHDWESFSTFFVTADEDGYIIELEVKVNYESLRNEIVNDVKFSIDWMTVYDNEGEEVKLDSIQSEKIKEAIEGQSYKA